MSKLGLVVGVCAMALCAFSSPATADDPHDKAMQNAAAHVADSASTKRSNQAELSYVHRRDADSMQSYDGGRVEGATSYARARADYERRLASWRHAVAACTAGQWDYCQH